MGIVVLGSQVYCFNGRKQSKNFRKDHQKEMMIEKCPRRNYFMGHVTILKRGQVLEDLLVIKEINANVVDDKQNPKKKDHNEEESAYWFQRDNCIKDYNQKEMMVEKCPRRNYKVGEIRREELIKDECFIGSSTYSASPSPSALPFPVFYFKK